MTVNNLKVSKETIQAPSLAEIIQTLREHRPALEEAYAVESLGVFGSFAHGSANISSDIDILVEFRETPTLFEFVRLQRQLSEILGRDVDLVMKSGLRRRIGQRILDEVVFT